MPNSIIAVGMDTFTGSVPLHHDHSEVEDRIGVKDRCDDNEVDVEEDIEEVARKGHNNSQWEPL